MSKTDLAEDALLKLVFQNIDWANIGDGPGLQNSATTGSLWVALFSVIPTDSAGGTEAAYTGYARIAVVRSASGWRVTGTAPTFVDNVGAVTFGACTASGETIVATGIMTALTSGDLLYYTALDDDLIVTSAPSITPEFAIGALVYEEA